MAKQLNRIETHSHYMPPVIYGAAGDYGPELNFDQATGQRSFRAGLYRTQPTAVNRTPGQPDKPYPTEPSARLADMDRLGIDVMGVAASPLIYCYGAKPEDGIRYCKVYNDAMAEYCAMAADRLFFIPTLPMQDIPASIAELERAHTIGGKAVNIGTDTLADMDLDDERLFPFYEYCEARDIAIWLHPAPPGTDDPNYNPKLNLADKYLFAWLIGYPHREMIAFATLVFSGVFDRFPNLKFCLPHGGGFVPYQFARLDYAWKKKLTGAIVSKNPVSEYLRNFYFDNVVHDARARKLLLEVMGPDNVFVGSNYGGWDWINGFDYAADMTSDPEVLYKLCAGNAIKLFKLDGMGVELPEPAEQPVPA